MRALRSLRLRLTLWYVLLLAVILAAFSAGIYLTLRHNLSSNLNSSLENRTGLLADIVGYEDGAPTLEGLVSGAGAEVDDEYVRVYDAGGALTFDTSGDVDVPPLEPSAIEAALDGRSGSDTLTIGDETMRVRAVGLVQDDQVRGVLEVGLSEDDMSETLGRLLLILSIAYPVTLAGASAGGLFLASRALSPIEGITRLARRISAQDLSERLEQELPDDELGLLARTFNDMIARLEDAFERQRQFTADASHELRTPLTAVKGQIEVALSREREPGGYREVLRAVNDEVDRLIRLVGSLLTLARADAGEVPLAPDQIDAGELVASAVEQVRPAAAERGIALSTEGAGELRLQADQDLLLQLLLNLLDNALKHTPRGSSVTAGWEASDGAAVLRVRDTGEGIPAEHLARVTDRFYRVDPARSRSAGGAGLGLSISRWIAEAHGGTLAIESVEGEGTAVEVRLPLR